MLQGKIVDNTKDHGVLLLMTTVRDPRRNYINPYVVLLQKADEFTT